jgi:hypothetical protein
MALMALGVTTLMGTSAALAQDVSVSGSVGCAVSSTTLIGFAHPGMGTIAKGDAATVNLAFQVQQGTANAACDKKAGTVTAAIGTGAKAPTGTALPGANAVTVTLGSVSAVDAPTGNGTIPVTATVPDGAATGAFGATVVLTLVDG